MSRTIDVSLRFNADTSSVKAQLNELKNTLYGLGSTKINIDGGSIDNAVQSARTLFDSLQQATDVNTGKLDFSKLTESLKKSNTSLRETSQQLLNLGPQGQKAYTQLATSIAQSEDRIVSLNKYTEQFIKTMVSNITWNFSNAILDGITGFVNEGLRHIEKLDESLTNIRIVTGRSVEDMAKFTKEANTAARALKTTTTEYSNASLIYFQQGLNDSEVAKRTDATIKMAKVTGESVTEVSNQLTSVWNNFADGTHSLEYYVDVITALGAATASSSDEITEGLEKFSAAASTVGLSYEYATAALATVTAETRQSADVVGTAFKTLFSRIQDLELGKTLEDGTTLGTYSKALEKVGINIKDQSGELKDMDDILDEMGAKWKTLSKDQQVALAQNVAGVRQYTQLISLMEDWDKVQKNVQLARNSEGSLNEQFGAYKDSMEALDDELQNVKESLYQEIFNPEMIKEFKKALISIMEFLERFLDNIGGLSGLLTFGGLFAVQALLPKLSTGLNNLKKSAKDIFGFTKKEKIEELEEMSNNLHNIAGKPTAFSSDSKAKNKNKQQSQDEYFEDDSSQESSDSTLKSPKQKTDDTEETKITYEQQSAINNANNASVLVDKRKEYLEIEHKLTETQKEQYQVYLSNLGQKEEAVRLANDEWATAEKALELEKERAKIAEMQAQRDTANKIKDLTKEENRIKNDLKDLDDKDKKLSDEEKELKDKKDPKSKERLQQIAEEKTKNRRKRENLKREQESNKEDIDDFIEQNQTKNTAVGKFQAEREEAGEQDTTVKASNNILKKEFATEGQDLETVEFPEASVENMEKIANLQAKYTADANKANQLSQTFTNLSLKGANSIKNNKKQQEALNKDLTSAKKLIEKYPDLFDDSDKEIKDIEKLIDKINNGVDLTEKEFKDVEKVIKKLKKGTAELRDETEGIGDAMIEDAVARGQGNDAYANSLVNVRDKTLEAANATNNLTNAQSNFNAERDKPPVEADPMGRIVESAQQAVQGLTQVAGGLAAIGTSWNTVFAEGASGAEIFGGVVGVLGGIIATVGGVMTVVGAIQKANAEITKRNTELQKKDGQVRKKNIGIILTQAIATMVGAEASKGFTAALIATIGAGVIVAGVLGYMSYANQKAAKEEEELNKQLEENAENSKKAAANAKEAAEAAKEEAERVRELNDEYQKLYDKYKLGLTNKEELKEKTNELAEALKNETILLMAQRGEWEEIAKLMGVISEEKEQEAIKKTKDAETAAVDSMAANYKSKEPRNGMTFGEYGGQEGFYINFGTSKEEAGDWLVYTEIEEAGSEGIYGWRAVKNGSSYGVVYDSTLSSASGNPAADWMKFYNEYMVGWGEDLTSEEKGASEAYAHTKAMLEDTVFQTAVDASKDYDDLMISTAVDEAPNITSLEAYKAWYNEQKGDLEDQGVDTTGFSDYLMNTDLKFYELIRKRTADLEPDSAVAQLFELDRFNTLVENYGLETVYSWADKIGVFGSLGETATVAEMLAILESFTGAMGQQNFVNNNEDYDQAISYLEEYSEEEFDAWDYLKKNPEIQKLLDITKEEDADKYDNEPEELATAIRDAQINSWFFTASGKSDEEENKKLQQNANNRFRDDINSDRMFAYGGGIVRLPGEDRLKSMAFGNTDIGTFSPPTEEDKKILYDLMVNNSILYNDEQKELLRINYTPGEKGPGGYNKAQEIANEMMSSKKGQGQIYNGNEFYGTAANSTFQSIVTRYNESPLSTEKVNSIYDLIYNDEFLNEIEKSLDKDSNTKGTYDDLLLAFSETGENPIQDLKEIYEEVITDAGFESIDVYTDAIAEFEKLATQEGITLQSYLAEQVQQAQENANKAYQDYINSRGKAEVEYYQIAGEAIEEYAQHLRDVIPELEDNKELSIALAEEYLVNQKALESLVNTWKDYSEIFKNPKMKNTPEWGQAAKILKQDLATMAGISASQITNEQLEFLSAKGFIDKLASTGDMSEIREYFIQQTFGGILQGTGIEQEFFDFIDKITSEAPNLKIGATLDDSEFIQGLIDMLVKAEVSATGIQAILDQLGWRGTIEYVTVEGNATIDQDGYTDIKGERVKVVSEQTVGTKTTLAIMRPKNFTFTGSKVTTPNSTGGGGGGKEKKKPKDEIERYHEIDKEIEDLTRSFERLSAAKDRAFGLEKIALMEEMIKSSEEELEAYNKKLEEAENYLTEDMANAIYWGIEIDPESGRITNYEEIMNAKIEEYNSGSLNEESYEQFKEDLNQYEETLGVVKDLQQNVIDKANEIMDMKLEKISYKVEMKIEVYDRDLSFIEYLMGKIEDDAFAAAEAINLIGGTIESNLNKIDVYRQGIKETFAETFSEDEINKILNGDTSILEGKNLTQTQVDMLREYSDALLEINTELNDVQTQIQEKIISSFDAWNEKIQVNIDNLSSYGEILTVYRDIADLVGQDNLGISNEVMNSISRTIVDNTAATVGANREKLEASRQAFKDLEEEYNRIRDTLTEADRKKWEETLDTMYSSVLTAENEFLSAFSSGLQTAADEFSRAVEQVVKDFEKAMSGVYGSFDALSKAYDQYSKTNERYLGDYQKIYELSKLNRDITKSIDDTDSIKAKSRLRDLQEEINKLQENNTKMTQYEVDELRARYDLRVAEIALEEAQNAKNQVRMTRDSEGNWSYVYTANQEVTDKAQQTYEDKLYAYQKLTQNRTKELESQLANLSKEFSDAMTEIMEDLTLSEEERALRMVEARKYFQEQHEYLTQQLGLSINHSKQLYEQDWKEYSKNTNYKISADKDWKDSFNETSLSIIQDFESLEDMHQIFIDNTELMVEELNKVYDQWLMDLDEMTKAAGTSISRIGTDIEAVTSKVFTETKNLYDEVDRIANSMTTSMQDVYNKAGELSTKYSEWIGNITTANEGMRLEIENSINYYAGIATANQILSDTYDSIRDSAKEAAAALDRYVESLKRAQAAAAGNIIDTEENIQGYKKMTEDKNGATSFSGIRSMKLQSLMNMAMGYNKDGQYFVFYLKNGEKIYYEVSLGSSIVNSMHAHGTFIKEFSSSQLSDWILHGGEVKEEEPESLDTGGYTGEWDSSGRLAMLHQKEIVLNASDTENFLQAVGIVREIANIIDLNVLAQAHSLSNLASASINATPQTLEQEVTIYAEFPNATDHNEIEEAFNNLRNRASQFANRKN